MLFLFYRKCQDIFIRLMDWVQFLPKRIITFFKHIFTFPKYSFNKYSNNNNSENSFLSKILLWCIEWIFLFMDIFGLSEIYEIIQDFIKFKSRPLNNHELKIAKAMFGNTINYRRVRVDNNAYIGPKQHRFAYVSFNIINSWGSMSDPLFIHEMTHVWQYQQMGAQYIPKALHAQHTPEGYNYGGRANLEIQKEKGANLEDFNLEQQADIVADYYRIQNGFRPVWGDATDCDVPTYKYFVHPIST